jgi:hypothetical protein
MAETFDWVKPSLLWQPGSADMLQQDFFRPTLLEFTTDKFMDDFLAAASAPRPAAFVQTVAKPSKAGANLKLFQPVHGNFYLTSASLCCRIPGFPDREVQLADGENVFFVLRRKVNGMEYAWRTSEAGKGWQPVGVQPEKILTNEERLPLFQTRTAQSRNIFFGYVPVASRDTYAASKTDSLVDYSGDDPRLLELDARFIGPLASPTQLFGTGATLAPADTQLRISVYLLLDLWEYFDAYLPDVAEALRDNTTNTLTGKKRDLTNYLHTKALGGTLKLDEALRQTAIKQEQLNEPGDSNLAALGFNADYNLRTHPLTGLNVMRAAVGAALEPQTMPPPVVVPKLSPEAGDLYVLRCVYERAQCDPPHLYVSRPSAPFELAPFFDPDAPARDIRVGLPVDVSIAGLRKFKKNVAFMMSNQLRKKLDGIAGKEKDLLDNNASISDGGIDIGLICSFSLPIITLCAFILLMIIVILLNLVFWWIPLLKICFPLGLSIKKN